MKFVITHTDLDGISAEILMRYKFKKEELVIIESEAYEVDDKVNEILDDICINDELFIVDCSPTVDIMETLNQTKFEKHLIDHHKPKYSCIKYDWANIKPYGNECGASMLCKHLGITCKFVTDFIELVRRYDTWEFAQNKDDNEPSDLNKLFFVMGKKNFIEHCLHQFTIGESPLNQTAMEIVKYKNIEIENYISNKLDRTFLTNIEGISAGVIMAESYKSELGNAICKTFRVPVAVVIGTEGVSLRSDGTVDVSKIAKKFGGGGRTCTAGFKIPNDIKNQYINKILGKEIDN